MNTAAIRTVRDPHTAAIRANEVYVLAPGGRLAGFSVRIGEEGRPLGVPVALDARPCGGLSSALAMAATVPAGSVASDYFQIAIGDDRDLTTVAAFCTEWDFPGSETNRADIAALRALRIGASTTVRTAGVVLSIMRVR